jgi:hypothetical protein
VTPYRLYRDALRCFGTWRQALSAAGVDIRRAGLHKTKRRQQTNEEIFEALRAWHAAGHSMAWSVICLENRQLGVAARARFKGWRRALLAAGIPVTTAARRRRSIWNPPRVLERIRRRHEQGKRLDENVVACEARRLLAAAREHFGSWGEALAAAGVDPRQYVGHRHRRQHGPLGDAEANDGGAA